MEEARFRQAYKVLHDAQRIISIDFAAKMGVSVSLVTHTLYETRRGVPVQWFGELCRNYGVSAQWLLTGEGNMFSKQ